MTISCVTDHSQQIPFRKNKEIHINLPNFLAAVKAWYPRSHNMQLCVPGSLSLGRPDYKHKELRALINSFLHSALFTRRTLINWHHRLQRSQETLRVELSFTRWMSQHCPMWFRKPWTQGLISSLFRPLYELASCVRVSRTHSLMSNKLHKYIKKELCLWSQNNPVWQNTWLWFVQGRN